MKTPDSIKYGLLLSVIFMLFACTQDENQKNSQSIVVFPEKMNATIIKRKSIPIFYEVVGTIQPRISTVLSSKIQGYIEKFHVNEGSQVKSGDVLILISNQEIAAKLDQTKAGYLSAKRGLDEIAVGIKQAEAQKKQAEANLALAQSTYNRYESLINKQIISKQDFETVQAKLKVAKAQVDAAKEGVAQLVSRREQTLSSIDQAKSSVDEAIAMKSYVQIIAPFDGVVTKKYAGIGSLAAPGTPLLAIENRQGFQLEIDAQADEFINRAKVGKTVNVKIDGLGDQLISGTIYEIVPTINPMSRTFKVKIALPDNSGIKSGMYGKAMCMQGEQEKILIPSSALIRRGQLEQVFIVDNEKIAHLNLVKTGKQFGNELEILSGLAESDSIITNPSGNLRDGYQVNVEVK